VASSVRISRTEGEVCDAMGAPVIENVPIKSRKLVAAKAGLEKHNKTTARHTRVFPEPRVLIFID